MSDNKQVVVIGYMIVGLLAINTFLLAGMYCKTNKLCSWKSGSGQMCPFSKKGSSSGSMKQSTGSQAGSIK